MDGANPPLHNGGVHEAVTAAAPGPEALAVPTLPKTVLVVAPVALTTIGSLELQVSGTPVKVMPKLSVTVASRVVELPVPTRNDDCELPKALIEIDWTGQVVN